MPNSKRRVTLVKWLISLVNPPPLRRLSNAQKVSRVITFSASLVMVCILSSMIAAVAIFVLQHVYHLLRGEAALIGDLLIIFVSMLVNTLCIMVLLHIKSADEKMIPPEETKPHGTETDSP